MKNNLFNKETLKYLLVALIVVFVGIFAFLLFTNITENPEAKASEITTVSNQILASGNVAAQNQAVLNFQIGGKLTYLPFKEGDKVSQGQVIAGLDSYALQKELQIAANIYQTANNSANQVQETQNAGVLEGQQRLSLDTTNKNSFSGVTENQVIFDNVKRIVDNANLANNSASLNVDLANYSLSLASLTSPINGIILHEDVTTPGVNVTPVTSFVVADPDSMVFSANVRQQDVNFISVGNKATVLLSGTNGQYVNGVVDRIYPQGSLDTSGEETYRVDIKIDNLPSNTKIGQNGSALIKSNFNQNVMLVPSWTVLSNSYVWVISNGKPVLKKVQIGDQFSGQTEIIHGLSSQDKIITNPSSLLSKLYKIL